MRSDGALGRAITVDCPAASRETATKPFSEAEGARKGRGPYAWVPRQSIGGNR